MQLDDNMSFFLFFFVIIVAFPLSTRPSLSTQLAQVKMRILSDVIYFTLTHHT